MPLTLHMPDSGVDIISSLINFLTIDIQRDFNLAWAYNAICFRIKKIKINAINSVWKGRPVNNGWWSNMQEEYRYEQ